MSLNKAHNFCPHQINVVWFILVQKAHLLATTYCESINNENSKWIFYTFRILPYLIFDPWARQNGQMGLLWPGLLFFHWYGTENKWLIMTNDYIFLNIDNKFKRNRLHLRLQYHCHRVPMESGNSPFSRLLVWSLCSLNVLRWNLFNQRTLVNVHLSCTSEVIRSSYNPSLGWRSWQDTSSDYFKPTNWQLFFHSSACSSES